MARRILSLTLFILALSSFLPCQDDGFFYIADKRLDPPAPGKEWAYMLIIIPVKYKGNDTEAFKDYQRYPRMKVAVSQEAYDLILPFTYYSLAELQGLKVTLQAERPEGIIQAAKPAARKLTPDESEQKEMELDLTRASAKVQFIRKAALELPNPDGKVTYRKMEQLRSIAYELDRANQGGIRDSFKERWGVDLFKKMDEEDVQFITKLQDAVYKYSWRMVNFSDGKKGQVKQFFEELTGRNDIVVESKRKFLSFLPIFFLCVLGAMIAVPCFCIGHKSENTFYFSFPRLLIAIALVAGLFSILFFLF